VRPQRIKIAPAVESATEVRRLGNITSNR
jgi:hypothetical protein